jgi:hypothetical protein
MFDPAELTTLKVGKKEYNIPPLRFKQLKRFWPVLEQINRLVVSETMTPEEMFSVSQQRLELIFKAFEVASDGAIPAATIEDNLRQGEHTGVLQAFTELLNKSGFAMGEAVPPAAPVNGLAAGAAPSGTESSPSTGSRLN